MKWDARRFVALLTISGAVDAASSTAIAGGFAIEQQNAAALGAAFAGAQARGADPGFAAYNPAAIGGVDCLDISVSATGVAATSKYRDAQGLLLGSVPISGEDSGGGYMRPAAIPNISLARPLGERLAVGLVLTSHFGLKSDFSADSVLRYQAQSSELLSLAASPTISFKAADGLTLGASLRLQYADLSIGAIIDAAGVAAASLITGFVPGTSDLPAEFGGDDLSLGFAAGFIAEVSPRLTVGGSYSSKITHDIEGDARFDIAQSAAARVLNQAAGLFAPTGFSTEFTTPAIAGVGLSYRACDCLTLLASATWTGWSSFDEVALVFENRAQPPEVLRQDWRDGWSVSAGWEWNFSDDTVFRAGLMYDATPVNAAIASPRIPDADRLWLSIGGSRRLGEKLSGDIGAAVAFFDDRDLVLSGAAPDALFRGSLSTHLAATAFAVSARLRYSF
jgi:long-chain fatty acid transport protein